MNNILFCHDTLYYTSQNNHLLPAGSFPYQLWHDRFLPHFDKITVIGRNGGQLKTSQEKFDHSNGKNVTHILMPNINHPIQRLKNISAVKKTIKKLVTEHNGIVIRGPSEFGMIAAHYARQLNKPYAIEMSGCAWDHTWHYGSLIGKIYAPIKYIRARHMVRHATQVIYVTKHFLQKRYPANGLTENASNVEIKQSENSVIKQRIDQINANKGIIKIGMIANYNNNLKGLSIAVQALHKLNQTHQNWQLHILGHGTANRWSSLIKIYNLADKIYFHEPKPSGKLVLNWLDQMNIYIQPSLHEGLPRAVIEAMSRGLPCLASNAGGTEELLDASSIHRKGNITEFSGQLIQYINDKNWQIAQAKQNFSKAKNYSSETLMPKRKIFWNTFSKITK